MSDGDILEDPPDDNEAYANLDEALDHEDSVRPGRGPEGERDLDTDLVVDETELQEAGADLDDPERISLLDGAVDDPDGSGPPTSRDDRAGWDVDPADPDEFRGWADEVDADGDTVTTSELLDVPDLSDDDAETPVDLDEIPDATDR
jgi:hypothetical protein